MSTTDTTDTTATIEPSTDGTDLAARTAPAAAKAVPTAAPAPVLLLVPGILGAVHGEAPFHPADPAAPQLLVTDLGVTRGEGVFETIGVFDGRPMALDAHLARLQRSADMEELPTLDRGVLAEAVAAAIDALGAVPEAMVRILVTAGPEHGTPGPERPTAWVHAKVAPDYGPEREGIRVTVLDRGLPTTAPATSPWLLAGAKSLSYAVNMASLREAARRGVDDVLYVSSDGYALEGPTSTLLVRLGDRYVTTPDHAGVLPGTSLGTVFEALRAEGVVCEETLLTPEQVVASDGAWLLSSARLAAPITHLDAAELTVDHATSARLSAIIAGRSV